MKKNKYFPKGLTLIELLVVIVIITIVISIGGNAYRDQQKHVNYNNAVFKVSNLIKTARNYAVTSRSVYDVCEDLEENRVYVPVEGYGVYIFRSDTPGESRAVLFANTEKDSEMEENQFDEIDGSCADSDLIEEDYTIPVDADLFSLSTDKTLPIGGNGTGDEAVIIFRPPVADALITVNDHPPSPELLIFLNDLYLQFRRPESDPSIPSTYIHLNHIAGFPEIEKE